MQNLRVLSSFGRALNRWRHRPFAPFNWSWACFGFNVDRPGRFCIRSLDIGLINRVVPKGTARSAAEKLAHEISAFPQECLLADRYSMYEQAGRSERHALNFELTNGRSVLNETMHAHVVRFADGAGRGGRYDDFT